MGCAARYTTTKLFKDYCFWKEGEVEAKKFYANPPPRIPGGPPQDYDFTPHTEAQFRVMNHIPTNPFQAFLIVDTMAAWTENGGDVPLSGLKSLRSYVSRMMGLAQLDETESALAASLLRPAFKSAEARV